MRVPSFHFFLEFLTCESPDDASKTKARKGGYAKMLKQPITIRLDRDTVAYFKSLAGKTGLPYQNLINLYLRDCATNKRQLSLTWLPQ